MAELALPTFMRLERLGDGRYRAPNETEGNPRDVVFGGQLLSQIMMAATAEVPDKFVKSVHVIFARPAGMGSPVELGVRPFHVGRNFATCNVEVSQGGRGTSTAVVLLDVDEPDLLDHAPPMPDVPLPEDVGEASEHMRKVFPGSQARVVDDVDTWVTGASPPGPAELAVWTRLPGAPDDRALAQAVLAYSTDGFLIGTAMRPYEIREDEAHHTISTGVVSHTLTFHRPFSVADWLLLAQEVPFAGRGRIYGRGHVFTRAGTLVASFVQESIIRHPPQGQAFEGRYRTVM